jgi:hypothetical protein
MRNNYGNVLSFLLMMEVVLTFVLVSFIETLLSKPRSGFLKRVRLLFYT